VTTALPADSLCCGREEPGGAAAHKSARIQTVIKCAAYMTMHGCFFMKCAAIWVRYGTDLVIVVFFCGKNTYMIKYRLHVWEK
jgi:hypothetical protein